VIEKIKTHTQAYTGRWSIALLIRNFGARWESTASRPGHFTSEEIPGDHWIWA